MPPQSMTIAMRIPKTRFVPVASYFLLAAPVIAAGKDGKDVVGGDIVNISTIEVAGGAGAGAGGWVKPESDVQVATSKIVPVPTMAVVITPPGPSQVSPRGQQSYSSLSPRLQRSLGEQPPVWSGQQVQLVSMQPEPQSFIP